MKNTISPELVDKYLNGKCSVEEELLLLDWYASFDDEADPVVHLTARQKEQIKERMFQNIRVNAGLPKEPRTRILDNVIIRRLFSAVVSAAAVILIVFSVSKLRQDNLASPVKTTSDGFTSIRNGSSQIQKHVFPDGSVAWLQPHALLSYNKSFNQKLRELSLSGEAFFYVAKNPAKPFIIHAKDIDVKVLGTSFNVKTGDNLSSVVSVLTGKVQVSTPKAVEGKKAVFLLPKQKAVYSQQNEVISRVTVDKAELGMWKKSSLSFNDTPVREVISTLNENFDARITVIDNDINQYTLKADFSGVNLPSVLEILGKALDVSYEVKEGEILLRKN